MPRTPEGSGRERRWWEAVDLPHHQAQGRLYRARRAGLARRRKVAFVLSGGGTLGATQVGALRALVEHGVHAEMVLGASVGALNGAAYAHGSSVENVERLRRAWIAAGRDGVFHHSRIWELLHFATRRPSVYEHHGLAGLIDQAVTFRDLSDAPIPLGIMVTALSGDPERCYWSGPARELLLASSALPGVFPSVHLNGEELIDGGVINNVPVSHAVTAGATTIYVVVCGPRLSDIDTFGPRPIDRVLGALALARKARVLHDLDNLPDDVEAIVIPGPSGSRMFYSDMSHTAELIEGGYGVASAMLDALGRCSDTGAPFAIGAATADGPGLLDTASTA
ncbi:MAG: patatin-like phospholipase family protein [Acidimicrobiales bacterium]